MIVQRWTVLAQEDFPLGAAWEALVIGLGPRNLMFLLFLLHQVTWVQEMIHNAPLFLPSFSRGWILALYSPSQLILTFHLLIRQVTTRVLVPSATFTHFLLVAITEVTLFRGLFSLMRPGRLWAHSMRWWQLFLEPLPHCTPERALLYSSFLLRAFWGLPLMACRSSLLGFGMPRTGSSSVAFLCHLDFRFMSLATSLLDAGLRP